MHYLEKSAITACGNFWGKSQTIITQYCNQTQDCMELVFPNCRVCNLDLEFIEFSRLEKMKNLSAMDVAILNNSCEIGLHIQMCQYNGFTNPTFLSYRFL